MGHATNGFNEMGVGVDGLGPNKIGPAQQEQVSVGPLLLTWYTPSRLLGEEIEGDTVFNTDQGRSEVILEPEWSNSGDALALVVRLEVIADVAFGLPYPEPDSEAALGADFCMDHPLSSNEVSDWVLDRISKVSKFLGVSFEGHEDEALRLFSVIEASWSGEGVGREEVQVVAKLNKKMGIIEKIKEIEAEMARTQKNKATEYHLGQLKAKIAKLRTQLLEPPKGSSGAGEGFEVTKYGHGRVALIGFPSVGKSTLLTLLTGTHSEAASYEFTTLTCIPGIIHYNDTKIQLLDLPGIIEGASEGKGRGRQVIAVSKSSDIVLMVLDASKSEGHRQILTKELEAVGLRLNKRPPQIYFKKKKTGGISFNSTIPLTHVDEKLCYQILHEYKIHNAEVLFREDATVDDLIDVIEGNRKYMKCIYVYNKIDVIGIDDVDKLARQPNSVVISCNLKLNLDRLLAKMWEAMGLVRVYTKPQGQQPDFADPVVLSADRGGCSVEDFCDHIHRSLVKEVKYVLVWGISARHYPQHCGLGHVLQDEDVVQIVKKKEREDGGRGRFKSHSNAPARISDREKKAPLKT
ncbi:Developmentally-regulated G-protein 2 [Camellia lanceoleosa]|uniref:Developmentally-regulated G-protein 2 n=1 Tax=Camellia lanceoleosa TaxID=1840588 RepID=A0ACC0I116_9ERIC|nr:Developmentally-regulated G-protein 2 [Camellia lanceoleosa]